MFWLMITYSTVDATKPAPILSMVAGRGVAPFAGGGFRERIG
jgi:hypothetical protein